MFFSGPTVHHDSVTVSQHGQMSNTRMLHLLLDTRGTIETTTKEFKGIRVQLEMKVIMVLFSTHLSTKSNKDFKNVGKDENRIKPN